MSAKVSGKLIGANKTFAGLKTVPKPFTLSKSKRTKVSIVNHDAPVKDEYVPLMAQVDNFFEKEIRKISQ